jgi:glycosyltransferase involved in cell wall biosynthesis
MSSFDVTIIIPTYNRSHLVSEAIDSCLMQTVDGSLKAQVLVVDDCSTDNTRNVMKNYGSAIEGVFLNKNSGQSAARNTGVSYARGRYIKFLDSDDILHNGTLAKEMSLADTEDADIVVSGWGTVRINESHAPISGSEKRWTVPDMKPLPEAVLWGRAVPTSAALYKKSYVTGLEWDMSIRKLTDWDWFCQAVLREGKIVALDEISYWKREHEGLRVTSSAPMVANAQCHHRILSKIERALLSKNQLTAIRARRLAQYYYKEMRVLCLYDRDSFERAVRHIYSLDAQFVPVDEERNSYMKLMVRVLGFRRAILLHSSIKKLAQGEKLDA